MKNIAGDVAAQVAGQIMGEVVMPVLIGMIAGAAVIYLIPSIIALIRGHKDKLGIFLVNLLLGWTIVGWIWAFVWAVSSGKRRRSSRKKKSRKK